MSVILEVDEAISSCSFITLFIFFFSVGDHKTFEFGEWGKPMDDGWDAVKMIDANDKSFLPAQTWPFNQFDTLKIDGIFTYVENGESKTVNVKCAIINRF